jgi:serine/threonine protein kinase
LYQCATGQRPFDAPSMYQVLHKIVQGSFDPPSKLRPDIPPDFERAILKAMARDPGDRYSSVLALGAALLPMASQRSRIIWGPTFADGGRSSLAPTSVPPPAEPLVEARPLVEPLAESGPVRSNTFGALSGASTGLHAPASGNKKLILGGIGLAAVGGALAIYLASRDSAVISVPLAEQAPRTEPARAAAPSASPSLAAPASASPSLAAPASASPSLAAPASASPSIAAPASASPSAAPVAAPVSPSASPTPASAAASAQPKASPTPKASAAAKPAAPAAAKPAASAAPAAGANNAPIIE